MSYQQEKFTAVADNIRMCLGTGEKIKPSEFATKVFDVFDAGRSSLMPSLDDANQTISEQRKTIEEQVTTIEKQESEILRQQNTIKSQTLNIDRLTNSVITYETQLENTAQAILDVGVENATIDNTAEKVSEVFETGKKAQYDEFWDNYQNYGNRTNYTGAFSFHSTDIFKPKYNITPTDATYMFYNFQGKIDLVEYLGNLNITLDFSKCTNFNNFMLWSWITRLGVIDASAANSISFYYAHQLETIDRLIIKDDGSETFNFEGANKLKNITIEGVIGKSVNMRWSPLSKNSINNVISVLSNTTTNLTLTLSQKAVNNEFETSEGAADGSASSEWTTLVATKSNWTISLV